MRTIGISNRGLTLIALLVFVLWGMIFAERALVSKARRDYEDYRRTQPLQAPVLEQSTPAGITETLQQPSTGFTLT